MARRATLKLDDLIVGGAAAPAAPEPPAAPATAKSAAGRTRRGQTLRLEPEALAELKKIGTNLTKIESRPVQGKPWEYVFYVDCQIGSREEGVRAMEALKPHCAMVKSLGCYQEAPPQSAASAQ